jgi:hypothetical protein
MIIPSKFDGYTEGGRVTSVRRVYDGGGSSAPATQTQVSDIPDWAKPYAQETLEKTKALTAAPYQAYGAPRIAGFSPLQEQAQQAAAGMRPSQLGQFGGQVAGAASIGALGTQYNPFRMGQFTAGRAAQYMNPFVEMAMEPQLREAQRSSEMQKMADQAQAVRSGAFGGSRQAIVEAERQRNLGMQQGDIRAKGYMSAFDQAQQQFAREQQLREQSRQFGAGLGMQGFQTALQGAGQLGALGGQQFGQEMDINRLQQQVGAQQQALRQQGLTQAYQDFLNEQNYPYKQLGFMSDMIRGLPLGQQSTRQLYEPPGSMIGQLGGIGTGLLGLSSAAKTFGGFAEGGEVQGYADGGEVTSDYNVDGILNDLNEAQLQQARLAALNRGDRNRLEMIDNELAERMSLRAGLGGAFNSLPEDAQENVFTAANGGIVAFSDGGSSGVGPEFGETSTVYEPPRRRSMAEVQRIVDQLRSEGRTIGLSDVQDIMEGKGAFRRDIARIESPPPAARPAAAPARAQARTETRAEQRPAARPAARSDAVSQGISQIAAQAGVPRETVEDRYARILKDIEGKDAADIKAISDMVAKSTGGSKEVKEGALGRALAEFGFKWAAAAAKPGAKFLSSAAEAAPSLAASVAESEKLAREMDRNDLKLQTAQRQFELSRRADNRKDATVFAAQIEQLQRQQDMLELKRRELAQTGAAQQAALRQRGEQFERMMGVRERQAGAQETTARAALERSRIQAQEKWEAGPGPRLERELAKEYGKNWSSQPQASAIFQQRKNEFIRGQSASSGSTTPLSSLLSTEDMQAFGLSE